MAIKTQTQTGSTERVIRTIVQGLVAFAAAMPALAGALHLSAAEAAKAGGIAVAFLIVVSAIQNFLEGAGVLPAMLKSIQIPSVQATGTGAAATIAKDVKAIEPIVANVVDQAQAAPPA